MGEPSDVFRSGEQTSMASDAAEHAGVLVVHLALDDSSAEGARLRKREILLAAGVRLRFRLFAEGSVRATLVGSRWNVLTLLWRRVVSGTGHAERSEYFALAEAVEGFTGEAFEGDAEDDKSDVAVFGALARIGGE